MSKYSSSQDIEDTMTKTAIQAELKELNVDFHQAEGVKKLSKKLFEHYDEGNSIVDVAVKEKPKQSDSSRWSDIAKAIEKEAGGIEKSNQVPKTLSFISKDYNYHLSPRGVNKSGKTIRYVKGLNSLNIAEQRGQADTFPQDWIKFRGLETPLKINNFVGRGRIGVDDPTLKEFITTNKLYGKAFTLYDEAEKNRMELEADRKITLLKAEVYKASEDDLIATLCYLSMRNGKANFEQMRLFDINKLVKTSLVYIQNDADMYLSAMRNPESRLIHLVHLARERNIISVSRDEREIKLSSSGNVVATSSVASNWEDDLVAWLKTEEGHSLANKLEIQCNYYIR